MKPVVDITGLSIPRFARKEIGRFVTQCLRVLSRAEAFAFGISEVSIVFVNDEEMTRLNATHRGKKRTTDVLTFEGDFGDAPPGAEARPLGEIIISVDQARRQAKEERHSLATELRYLILHGIIHALGFDHEQDDGAMDTLEEQARTALRLN